jgi:hypothetical protein
MKYTHIWRNKREITVWASFVDGGDWAGIIDNRLSIPSIDNPKNKLAKLAHKPLELAP